MSAVTARAVTKSYLGVEVLHGIDLGIEPGSLTLLTGPSGSGKTTLLNLLSGLDLPDSGDVTHGDHMISKMNRRERARLRAANGLVFQRSGMLGGLTIRENVEAAHCVNGRDVDAALIEHYATRLGIDDLLDAPANRVSGGQAQRAALVRSLVHQPSILFADEPTASLDTASKHLIHEVIRQAVDENGVTAVVVSHDDLSADYATHVHLLTDGRLATEGSPHA